jgi:hypothetical protein
MDMQLYSRVLLRWWPIMLIGLLVAGALTFLSLFRVDTQGHVTARKSTQYVSYTQLFVTQKGFPWGRLGLTPTSADYAASQPTRTTSGATQTPRGAGTAQLADLSRLTSLAILYSHLATSDQVRAIMLRLGPVTGTLEASALPATQNSNEALPIISIAAITDSATSAIALAQNASTALVSYIEQQQAENGILPADRVQLTTLNRPYKAKIFQKPSKTLPVVIFLTVLIATIGVAFIFENLRPRIRTVPGEPAASARSA